MSPKTLTPAMRTARFLNLALNVVIVFLALCLVLMLILPFFSTMIIETIESGNGNAPSLPVLNMSGAVGGSLIAAAYLYVALVVKRIVKTTLDGNPFVEENISRLRKTWVVIALVEIIRMIAMGFIDYSAMAGSGLDGFTLKTSLPSWFLVFVIATMAEVFRIGLELRRDQDLTV